MSSYLKKKNLTESEMIFPDSPRLYVVAVGVGGDIKLPFISPWKGVGLACEVVDLSLVGATAEI